jgi:3-oxoacyl-[acyl-carrier protein] reductase
LDIHHDETSGAGAMNIDLSGKRAVVTGGSRGIGRAIALACAEAGAAVSICARGAETLDRVRDEIAAHGVKAHTAVCDLADAAAVERYIADSAAALGGIDILVNNASGFGTSHDEAGWAASINVDLLGTVRATRAARPFLEQSGAGAIINISSISGLAASARTPPYGAVKAAIIEYTLSEAALLAKKGIRVNCIAPGSIEFPGGSWERRKTDNPQLYNSILRSIPFGRLGRGWRPSSLRRSPAGSPARQSRSMAASCFERGQRTTEDGSTVSASIR